MIEKTKVEQVMMMIKERPLAGQQPERGAFGQSRNEVKEVDDAFGSD